MESLFLAYSIHSYEHDPEHVAACEVFYQLPDNMFAVGSRHDEAQFTKFIGIFVTMA